MLNNSQNENAISVAYATDRNYLFYTCVSITSLAESADKGTRYQVYILVGEEFRDEDDLLGKLEKRYSNIKIAKTVVDSSVFTKVFINNKHISRAAFYRLALCDILSGDKCIYLDSDTIVTEDLSSLYTYSMENCYLAGCRDIWIDVLSAEEREERRIQTCIPDLDEYINSGILLFNLKKIRENKLNDLFLENLNYDYPYEDQDILNVCCYHHIFWLPVKWNRFTAAIGRDTELRMAGVPVNVVQEFKKENGIIHFITEEARPWKGFVSWENWRWWQFAWRWNEEEAFKKIYYDVEVRERQNSWKECLRKYSEYRCIVIWGFTEYATELCQWLLNAGLDVKISFCDSDERKQGKRFKGIEVKSPEQIFFNAESVYFIIASQRWGKEIERTLLKNGIPEEDVQIYKRKGLAFYRMLDRRYYAQELEEVFLKEGITILDGQAMPELLRHEEWVEKYNLKRWILKEAQYQMQ